MSAPLTTLRRPAPSGSFLRADTKPSPARKGGRIVMLQRSRMLRLLAAGLPVAGILARPHPARAQGDELIKFGASPFEAQGIAFYAQELGYYKRAGLNVDVQMFPGGAAILAAIAGGSLQL